jgi:hypothetical protein
MRSDAFGTDVGSIDFTRVPLTSRHGGKPRGHHVTPYQEIRV